MKHVYAQSYREFAAHMKIQKIDDSNVEERTKSAIIEIMGEQDLLFFPFYFKQDHPNVLRLLFDDVDEPLKIKLLGRMDEREDIPVVPMNEDQGRQIVDFVKNNGHCNSFIIHCAAGISRSSAVALYINSYFYQSWAWFKQLNPHTKPNARIVKMLKQIYDSIQMDKG